MVERRSSKDSLSLGIVTPQLNSYGGSEIYLLECLKRWQERASITVYTPSFRKRLFREFGIADKVKVINLPSAPTKSGRFMLFHEIVIMPRVWEESIQQHDVYFLYLFPTQMVRRRPSVWFAAEPCRMIYDLRLHPRSRDSDVKVHIYPQSKYHTIRVSDLEIILQVIEKIDTAAVFDRLATNSELTGKYVENIYGKKVDRVAYPGITLPDEVSPPPIFDKILHVGRLWRHKRIDLAIKAVALTRSPNQLILVGDGPEKSKLKKLAAKLGLKDQVLFTGEISMEERERLYRECTCCVYTPVREPFGMVPLEAAAAGRPVVATPGGGYSEILTDEAAIFVPAYEGAIAEGIHRLMSSPSLAMAMGRAGRSIVEPYTWDRTAEILMELFLETADRPRRKAGKKTWNGESVLGAHYYPWYRAGKKPRHWNENSDYAGVTDFPLGGPYSSTDPAVIKKHLDLADEAGLDFLVINWQVDFRGINVDELEATNKLFETIEVEKRPLKLAIMLAFNTEDPRIFLESIRMVEQELMPKSTYHRHRESPLLWFFFNDHLQGFFYHYYQELKNLCRSIYPVATGGVAYNKFMPEILRDFFKGWCLYSPLEIGPARTREIIWRESYRSVSEEYGKLNIFTISPGFDDSHLTAEERMGRKHRRIPRRVLKTYEQMQESALRLNPPPDYVIVTSFNEFHENTHIEPSNKHGDRFIYSTRDFKEKLLG